MITFSVLSLLKFNVFSRCFQNNIYIYIYIFFFNSKVFIQVLDVNDNSPEFTRALYTRKLVENVAVDTVVQVVKANDADIGKNGHVLYNITAGNEAGNISLKL